VTKLRCQRNHGYNAERVSTCYTRNVYITDYLIGDECAANQ